MTEEKHRQTDMPGKEKFSRNASVEQCLFSANAAAVPFAIFGMAGLRDMGRDERTVLPRRAGVLSDWSPSVWFSTQSTM